MSGGTLAGRVIGSPEGRLAIIAVAVFALMSILSPELFLSQRNLTSMAFQFPEFAILALAMTLTMMTGGIDLSVVGVANLSAVLAATVLATFAGPDIGLAASLPWLGARARRLAATGAAAGALNGLLVARLALPPILATLGSGLVFTGLAVAFTGGSAVMGFPDAVAWLGNGKVVGVPVPLIVFAAAGPSRCT